MTVNFRFFICITLMAIGFAGCNQDEDCAPAYVDSVSVPEDSLCFGNWEWIYTVKYFRPSPDELSYVIDTIFPGDSELGFETVHFANGTVGKAEIFFNVNGHVVCGCYKRWNSVLYPALEPTYVSTNYYEWTASGYGALGVDANLPVTEGDPVIAKIGNLNMFRVNEQQEDTVFYRNWFVKVD